MSDGDFTGFGSGSSRRNGLHLEPDEAPAPSTSGAANATEVNRSWIIYVLGGSYPENHPILTTPSLFTDSPTYEDMLLLSSLLGPAKPPVAAAEDVASAPGLFRIATAGGEHGGGRIEAHAVHGDGRLSVHMGERCLVCLCDYQTGEEARRLVGCGHLFHRECIDQVSQPLCFRSARNHRDASP